MDEFEELEDDDDIYNAELSIPHVIVGLLMMVLGLAIPLTFNLENDWLKYLCFLIFISSFFVMTVRKKYP
jgi:hypothetical protein